MPGRKGGAGGGCTSSPRLNNKHTSFNLSCFDLFFSLCSKVDGSDKGEKTKTQKTDRLVLSKYTPLQSIYSFTASPLDFFLGGGGGGGG